jgi:hypothetical protein
MVILKRGKPVNKSKRQPKNFFRYFLDEFILFRRDFYFEIDAEPEIVLEKLRALKYEKSGWGSVKRIYQKISENSDGWHFVTTLEVKNNKGYDYSNIAKGDVYTQGQLTVLEGQLTMGSNGYMFIMSFIGLCLAMILIISFGIIGTKMIAAIIGLIAFALIAWIQGYSDRNHLYNLIQSVVESAHEPDKAKAS